jgi:FAD/FMN-containing dehydrogenase
MVWIEIERYLSDRDLIESEIGKYRQGSNQKEILEGELDRVNRQIKAVNREQHRLLQWALKGFPETQVETENKRLNQTKKTLETQKAELETRLKTNSNTAINVEDLEDYISDIQHHLKELDNEAKRLALNMLGITIWLDGKTIEINGVLDPGIVLTSSEGRQPLLKYNPPLLRNALPGEGDKGGKVKIPPLKTPKKTKNLNNWTAEGKIYAGFL